MLLFDYDGTLTPIVEQPHLAVLDGRTKEVLASLADRPRVHVGILSGRELDELKSLLPMPGLYLAGTAGMELELRGFRMVHPHAGRMANTMNRLAAQLEGPVAAHPGAWLEKKKFALTIHYRHLPGRRLGSLQAAVADVTRLFVSEVRIVQGPKRVGNRARERLEQGDRRPLDSRRRRHQQRRPLLRRRRLQRRRGNGRSGRNGWSDGRHRRRGADRRRVQTAETACTTRLSR